MPRMLARPVGPQTDTTWGDPIDNFDKLVTHIDSHVIGLDNPLGRGTAVKLYIGYDTNEANGKTIKKRKTRKKETFSLLTEKKLLDYCGEKKLVLQTHTGIPDVIIQKKLASVSRTLPLVLFDKKCLFPKIVLF